MSSTKHVTVAEQVAIFLNIVVHHKKNCIVKHNFLRSGRTVSKHFHVVLNTLYRISYVFLAKATPITDDCSDPRWRWFKGCLGALDGTFVYVRVREHEKGRYRTRKGQVAVNVLGVCNPNMQFIYVLLGWEGSAADSRVLPDAIHRPHGLRVPSGNYYLCDNGYTNAMDSDSLREVRYHLKVASFTRVPPDTSREYPNPGNRGLSILRLRSTFRLCPSTAECFDLVRFMIASANLIPWALADVFHSSPGPDRQLQPSTKFNLQRQLHERRIARQLWTSMAIRLRFGNPELPELKRQLLVSPRVLRRAGLWSTGLARKEK
ncbi:UNVERIFIED_CONTAM: hypothetical protein Sradi_5244000 [Sesamum radiatum]|uniref:DDE Tnp4 domain-containing protein n=1 Tax=Sesamum radiatum TaxID=300843 RepID=A0AAW2LN96_SESRA